LVNVLVNASVSVLLSVLCLRLAVCARRRGWLAAIAGTYAILPIWPGAAPDAADKESCRPDFAVAIYPGHLSLAAAEWDAGQGPREFVARHPATADKGLALNPDIHVTSQTPPTFLLHAENDPVDGMETSLAYYI